MQISLGSKDITKLGATRSEGAISEECLHGGEGLRGAPYLRVRAKLKSFGQTIQFSVSVRGTQGRGVAGPEVELMCKRSNGLFVGAGGDGVRESGRCACGQL